MRISRKKIVLILVMMSISIGMLVYSFAFTTIISVGTTTNYLTVSGITFGLTDSTDSINLGSVTPTLDKFGLENAAFSFSITNTDSIPQGYTVRLIDGTTTSTIPSDNIRYQLTINGVTSSVKKMSLSGVIDSGSIAASATNTYSIIFWLAYDSNISNGTWTKVVKVEAGTVNIDKSGANEPILPSNMIPVYYNKNDDTWRKADVTNSNIEHMWYDYDARVWANAVTVSNTNRATYLGMNDGEPIPMSDILSFFVWIPRYKYTIFNTTSEKSMIDITFEKGVRNTGTMKCKITNGREECSDLINGSIVVGTSTYTHPAFTFGDEELTGIWVSKFELSPISTSTCYENVTSSNCNVATLDMTSKPEQKSLHSVYLSNLFTYVRQMEINGNIHGFVNTGTTLSTDGTITSDSNNLDIHAIKGFELGSIIYMTYSKYGKFGDITYSDENKDIFNKTSVTRTGTTYVDETTYAYNVDYYGTGGSTTGNIYGIYDLSGNVSEYAMVNVLSTTNEFTIASSGFTTAPNSKYYDAYSNRTTIALSSGYYGDAVYEIKDWLITKYSPYAIGQPFVVRDGALETTISNGKYNASIGGRASLIVSQDIYIIEW